MTVSADLTSPDLTGYLDLTLYDKDPQDLYDDAIAWMQSRVPEFVPNEANIEVVLLEALAQLVAEGVYAINRMPGAIVQILLMLFGVDRFDGTQPTAEITVELSDDLGRDIPAGTQFELDLGDATDPVIFTSDDTATANPGETSVTLAATGDRYTADANGVPTGTPLTVISSAFYVNSASLTAPPTGGADPEDTATWLTRGVTTLGRLTNTLALPSAFEAAALVNPAVFRALTIDSYNGGYEPPGGITATPSASGGTLHADTTYYYAITATTASHETDPETMFAAIPAGGGDTGSVVLTWEAPPAQIGAAALTGYKIYRSNDGGVTYGLLHTVAGTGTFTYTDTGGAPDFGTPPPVVNSTGIAAQAGFVTIAVYGEDGPLPLSELEALQAQLSAQALANLNVRVVNATLNLVPVVVSVVAAEGFVDAAVQDAVVAAVQSALSPDSWDWSSTLKRNRVIAIVGSLPEVAEVDVLTTPAADVPLVGVAPLVQGVISVGDVTVES